MNPPALPSGDRKIIVSCLLILTALALALALHLLSAVLVPLVLAMLSSSLVLFVVEFLHRRLRFPRSLAMLSSLLAALGLALLFVMMLSSSAARLAERAPLYQQKLVDVGTDVLTYVQDLGIPVDTSVVATQVARLPLGSIIAGTLNSVLESASMIFLVLLFVVYLVTGRKAARVGSWPGESPSDPEPVDTVRAQIEDGVRKYLAIKVAVSTVTGLLVWLLLAILGLDLAVVFGILAFLLNFIPSVGSIIATFLPLPLALVQFDSGLLVVLSVLLPGAVQMTVGNVIEPRIMGESLDLHPIVVLLCLVFWGILWGIPGMVLAAPMTAVLKIILQQYPQTRTAADILAGKLPSLTHQGG
jgi:AI-2 transport protein TqsA